MNDCVFIVLEATDVCGEDMCPWWMTRERMIWEAEARDENNE